ncbi:FadD3 family acyl-CoA ligase [Streptomyces himalayensis]|uniref:Fatty acid--CoA ligase family protein n=1 Tax=Streptomyces himalayensis subsp. himalayensis TaxID=2756131 RepID=A0A7W0I9Z9_9ACTN|nr:FadD3 family acyl-CoA ligase [Streptomyces himalayensis]MBA2947855.1 fatty acid--CoA ligase family protein [Streptomyces himalayensis subsp. himalayensis]
MASRWRSIPELVLSAADRFGDAEAVVDGQLRLTFTELADRVRRAAGAFASAGVSKGDRVAVWAPNSAEWIIAAFGLLTAGGVLVPVNTRFQDEEAHDIVRRSGAKALLVQNGFLDREFTGPPGVPVIDVKSDFLASGTPLERGVDGDDLSDIVFTSGTTGRPKGVMMTHDQTLRAYAEWCDLAGLRQGDRYLIVNPFFHIFGYKAGCVASLIRGATILPVAVFDVDRVLDLVEKERVTVLPGPPTLYHSLLEAGGGRDLSSLRVAVTGSADIPVELVRRVVTELPFKTLMTGYGLTEAGTVTASRPGDPFEVIATTVGTPCEGFEVCVADDGEVLVRGYGVMRGYFDDPEATADAIDADGWLHTGDLGELDDEGRLRIVGRKKDMFIVGGFNAYPAEIEGFLLEHPAVAQVAVVGVPDERMGQVGKAFVVPRGEVTAEELTAWSRKRMAGFKVPRYVEFRTELPLTATGKVLKDQLR